MAECIGSYQPVTLADATANERTAECPECGQTVGLDWGGTDSESVSVIFDGHHDGRDPLETLDDEWAIELDRRFEQYRDDEITARHTGEA